MGSSNGQLGSVRGLFAFAPGSHAGGVRVTGHRSWLGGRLEGCQVGGNGGRLGQLRGGGGQRLFGCLADRVKATSQTVRQPARGSARAVPQVLFYVIARQRYFTWSDPTVTSSSYGLIFVLGNSQHRWCLLTSPLGLKKSPFHFRQYLRCHDSIPDPQVL